MKEQIWSTCNSIEKKLDVALCVKMFMYCSNFYYGEGGKVI